MFSYCNKCFISANKTTLMFSIICLSLDRIEGSSMSLNSKRNMTDGDGELIHGFIEVGNQLHCAMIIVLVALTSCKYTTQKLATFDKNGASDISAISAAFLMMTTMMKIFRPASGGLPEEASQHARHCLHHCAGRR